MVTIDKAFWSGKSVLVTGHTGFKGAWLSLWLHRLGAEVHGLSLPPTTNPSLFEVLNLETIFKTSVLGDISDFAIVNDTVKKIQPDIVFHLAAQALVRRAYHIPVETITTNVIGTTHILEAIAQSQHCKVGIMITTDKVYENKEWMWPYRESDELGGHEPYGVSKAAAELVIKAYQESYFQKQGKALSSVRAGNVVGGGDWSEDRLVPDAVRAFITGQSLVLRNPAATRPWQQVLEPLFGYLLLAQKSWHNPDDYSIALNFGPDGADIRPVSDVAESCVQFWGEKASWRSEILENPIKESQRLSLDNALAKQALGWQPRWDFDNCMERSISWYKAQHQGLDMLKYSNKQIDEFNG